MPAAVAIPLITAGVTTGATLYGVHKASQASDKAAKVQNDAAKYAADQTGAATTQSLNLQRDMFNRGQAELAPYTGLGRSAGSTLARMMGLPAMPAYQPAPMLQAPAAQTPAAGNPFGQLMSQGRRTPTGTDMTRLIAPDGSIEEVPTEQVDHFLSMGARRAS